MTRKEQRRIVCGNNFRTHGATDTREWKAWKRMKDRCYQPTNIMYHRYGARGIKVCAAWKNDFSAFLADMGKCPEGQSLDRINNDKGYSRSNCRWATKIIQANNTSANRFIKHAGRRMTLANWARAAGMKVTTLWDRLAAGWKIERALTQPTRTFT